MSDDLLPCANGCGGTYRHYRRRKTKLCVTCSRSANGRNPSKISKSRAAMLKRMSDPAIKAEALKRAHDGWRKRLAEDPELRARMADRWREVGKSRIGHLAMPAGSPARRRAVASRMKTIMPWCPPEYLDEYRRLLYSKKLKAVDARAVIEQMIAADQAKMTPFEKQLQRVRNGEVGVVNKFVPTADTGPYTLGGVASGML